MGHYADRYNRGFKSSNLMNGTTDDYQEKGNKVRREKKVFLQREFDYRDYIFAPEGYEGFILFLYIMIIPYLVALLFLFLFIAKSSYQLFLEFKLTSYLIIWAIGYELCAALAIIIFFYAWFSSDSSDDTPKNSARSGIVTTPRFRD